MLEMISVLRCSSCSTLDPGPRELCGVCRSDDLQAHDIPGNGTLVSWTLIRKPPTRFKGEPPYAVAVVDLAAGVRVTGRLVAASDDIAPGARVVSAGLAGACLLFAAVPQ